MQMTLEPTIEIEASRMPMVLVVIAGFSLTGLSIAFGLQWQPGPDDVDDIMIGAVGTAMFGLGTALGLWRLLMPGGSVVTIAPEGIRDRRIAGEMVPWSAVGNVFTWEDYRRKVMVVAIDAGTERMLTRTWLARRTREADRRMGAAGLCVTALGLRTDHERLLAMTLAYLEAWRTRRAAPF